MDSAPLFTPLPENAFEPSEFSRGPWSPDLLHGGPVGALLANRMMAIAQGGPWFPTRIAIDLMRPMVAKPFEIKVEVIRAGRQAMLVSAQWMMDGACLARATLQLVSVIETPIPDDSPANQWTLEGLPSARTDDLVQIPSNGGQKAFHSHAVDLQWSEAPNPPGRRMGWVRITRDLLPGEPLSALERVVATADFTAAFSGGLLYSDYTFINSDIVVHLFRLPVGKWILMDASTHSEGNGVGLAEAALYDERALMGRSSESVVIRRRP